MHLVIYDVGRDPKGVRVRLVRCMRRLGGLQLQRSVWLVPEFSEELSKLLDEIREGGGSVLVTRFRSEDLAESKFVGVVVCDDELVGLLKEVVSAFKSMKVKFAVDRKLKGGRSISSVVDRLCRRGANIILLVTRVISFERGMALGAEVYENSIYARVLGVTFLELAEVYGKRYLISWSARRENLIDELAEALKAQVAQGVMLDARIKARDGLVIRKIYGVRPGDEIYVNDVPVAKALTSEVALVCRRKRLIDVIGGVLYKGAAKKLGRMVLEEALVRTEAPSKPS